MVKDALQLPSELFSLWHAHRTEIILTAGILLALVRLAIHWRSRLPGQRQLPPSLKPVDPAQVLVESGSTGTDRLDPLPSTKPRRAPAPKRVIGGKRSKTSTTAGVQIDAVQPFIFYYTLGGSTKAHAETLARSLSSRPHTCRPHLHDLTEIDYDDFFITAPKVPTNIATIYLLLIPTYNIDTELSNFLSHLEETHYDFRIDTAPLREIAGYTVFGIGDRQEWPSEEEGYCTQAVEVDRWMARLTARKRAFPLGMGDTQADLETRIAEWRDGVQNVMADIVEGKGLGEGVPGSGEAVESGDEDDAEPGDETKPRRRRKAAQTSDLEDMKVPIPVDFTTTVTSRPAQAQTAPKLMVPVSSPTYTSLTKQGYTIVGSHSGVKICRWTKSALRGRGSCYKYSFYGIASHLCMEATPFRP
nr:s-adenosyl-l-methionine-dependent trna 4-demethylwyosine synthase [Quercus suber]